MKLHFFILIMLFCSTLLLAEEERSVEEIKEEAQEHFEDGFDKAAIGGIGVGYGAFRFSTGDPLGGAVGIGSGVVVLKESIKEFKKAKELFDEAREREAREEGNSCDNDEQRDRVDSWDVDY